MNERGDNPYRRRPYELGNPSRWAVRWEAGNFSQPFATRAKAEKVLHSFGGHGRIVSVNPGAFSNPPEDLEQADELYEGFHGVPSEFFDVAHEPHIPSGNYVKVGKLVALEVKPALGGQVREIKPSGVIVVSTPNGSQLHFVGGHQDLSAALRRYTADLIGEEIELGHARAIVYRAAKPHEGHAEQVDWDHKFGEEGGELPRVIFDKPNKRLLLRGGSYRIEKSWIRD